MMTQKTCFTIFIGLAFAVFAFLGILFGTSLETRQLFAQISNPVQNPQILWFADFAQATQQAQSSGKFLFLHFYADQNCPPCQEMDQQVFTNPQVVAGLTQNYIAVRVNVDQNLQLAEKWGVTAIPTNIILKPSGEEFFRRKGGTTAEDFLYFLGFLLGQMQNEVSATPVVTGTDLPGSVNQAAQKTVPPVTSTASIRDPFTAINAPAINARVPANPPVVASTALAVSPATKPNVVAPQKSVPTSIVSQVANLGAAPEVHASEKVAGKVDLGSVTVVEVPLALDGYCPVTLGKEEKWMPGNPAFYTMFRGHVFRFADEAAMEIFLKKPLDFVPVAMGEDIVMTVDRNKRVYGNRKFGAWFQDCFPLRKHWKRLRRSPNFILELRRNTKPRSGRAWADFKSQFLKRELPCPPADNF